MGFFFETSDSDNAGLDFVNKRQQSLLVDQVFVLYQMDGLHKRARLLQKHWEHEKHKKYHQNRELVADSYWVAEHIGCPFQKQVETPRKTTICNRDVVRNSAQNGSYIVFVIESHFGVDERLVELMEDLVT